MLTFAAVLWVFAGILSPFLTFCSYGLLKKRLDWLAGPEFVTPSVILASLAAYEFTFATPQGIVSAHYDHFLYAGAFFLVCYFVMNWGYKYSNADSFVLSVMTLFAIDELWQTPYNVVNWTESLWAFQVGISTAAWNLMAIPFAFYFVKRINERIRFDYLTSIIFYVAALLTIMATLKLIFDPYWLIIPWFAFFLALFRSSKISFKSTTLP